MRTVSSQIELDQLVDELRSDALFQQQPDRTLKINAAERIDVRKAAEAVFTVTAGNAWVISSMAHDHDVPAMDTTTSAPLFTELHVDGPAEVCQEIRAQWDWFHPVLKK